MSLSGVDLIAAERARQVDEEGYSPEHDDRHSYPWSGVAAPLARAATFYAFRRSGFWPFVGVAPELPFEPTHDERVRELVKAGALVAAEIDRLNRREETSR